MCCHNFPSKFSCSLFSQKREILESLSAIEYDSDTEEARSPEGTTETRKRLLTGTLEPLPPSKRGEFDLEETEAQDSGSASGSQIGILDLSKVK